MPQSAVMPLQTAIEIASTFRRLERSARAAIGMPNVEKNRANAMPVNKPSCVSVAPNSALMDCSETARTDDRSITLMAYDRNSRPRT